MCPVCGGVDGPSSLKDQATRSVIYLDANEGRDEQIDTTMQSLAKLRGTGAQNEGRRKGSGDEEEEEEEDSTSSGSSSDESLQQYSKTDQRKQAKLKQTAKKRSDEMASGGRGGGGSKAHADTQGSSHLISTHLGLLFTRFYRRSRVHS
jgi:hypothetical protein